MLTAQSFHTTAPSANQTHLRDLSLRPRHASVVDNLTVDDR